MAAREVERVTEERLRSSGVRRIQQVAPQSARPLGGLLCVIVRKRSNQTIQISRTTDRGIRKDATFYVRQANEISNARYSRPMGRNESHEHTLSNFMKAYGRAAVSTWRYSVSERTRSRTKK